MSKTNLRIVSAITSLALLAGTAGVASIATLASAASPVVTTQAATGITASNATLNGTNGDTDATGSAFWVSTSTFTPAAGASPVLPSGVYSTGDLGAQASSTNFSAQLSSATIPAGLLPITASTTYYFTAWSQVGGVWTPGSVLSFNTSASAPATTTISNVAVSNIGTSSATISWNTNVAATGQVRFGTTTGLGSVMTAGTASTSQSVTLTNLNEGSVYFFAIDANNGSATTSTSNSSFVTLSTASSTPLAVTGIDAISTTATADNSYTDGWKWVMHLTVPDNENAFRIRFSDWAMSSTTSFPSSGNVRVFSPQSSNANSEGTAITSSGNTFTANDWLYLNGDAASSTPGRQINLTIEVKIPVGTPNGSYTTTFTAQSFPQSATSTASL